MKFPPLPKPLSYVWPENDECCFPCHYTPAGPGGPFYEGAPRPDGLNSFPIYTKEQLEEYAVAAVLLNEANRIKEEDD